MSKRKFHHNYKDSKKKGVVLYSFFYSHLVVHVVLEMRDVFSLARPE